jgi:hypothetical protein
MKNQNLNRTPETTVLGGKNDFNCSISEHRIKKSKDA